MNTNLNAIFATLWLIEGVWALARLAHIGSGALPNKVSATPLPAMLLGGLGMIFLTLTFFSNLTVFLALVAQIKRLPGDLGPLLGGYATVLSQIGIAIDGLGAQAYLKFADAPHWVALAFVLALLTAGELLLIPASIVHGVLIARRSEKALSRIEAQLGKGAGVYDTAQEAEAVVLPGRRQPMKL